jgi:DNA-binding transcriptional MerR regulator
VPADKVGSAPPKSAIAFRTIGEVSAELNIPQHILRYWETRFPQLRPLQRAGNRRYYRPADVELVRRIDRLLNHEGYTIRGVRKLLDDNVAGGNQPPAPVAPPAAAAPSSAGGRPRDQDDKSDKGDQLRAVRDMLADALRRDEESA